MCALTEVPSVVLPSPSGFCQSRTLTAFANLESKRSCHGFLHIHWWQIIAFEWLQLYMSLCLLLSKNYCDFKSQTSKSQSLLSSVPATSKLKWSSFLKLPIHPFASQNPNFAPSRWGLDAGSLRSYRVARHQLLSRIPASKAELPSVVQSPRSRSQLHGEGAEGKGRAGFWILKQRCRIGQGGGGRGTRCWKPHQNYKHFSPWL